MKVIESFTAFKEGTDSATIVLPPKNGISVVKRLWYKSPAGGTITVARYKLKTDAVAAVAAASSLVVNTDALGYINGSQILSSDILLICGSNGSGWQIATMSSVGIPSDSTVELTLNETITCAAGDAVYIARNHSTTQLDVHTLVTGTETVHDDFAINGYRDMPTTIVLAATGLCRIGVDVDVEE